MLKNKTNVNRYQLESNVDLPAAPAKDSMVLNAFKEAAVFDKNNDHVFAKTISFKKAVIGGVIIFFSGILMGVLLVLTIV